MRPRPIFAGFTLAFALKLRKKARKKTSVRVAGECQIRNYWTEIMITISINSTRVLSHVLQHVIYQTVNILCHPLFSKIKFAHDWDIRSIAALWMLLGMPSFEFASFIRLFALNQLALLFLFHTPLLFLFIL